MLLCPPKSEDWPVTPQTPRPRTGGIHLIDASPFDSDANLIVRDQRRSGKGARFHELRSVGPIMDCCTGDPATGKFQDAVILAQFGEVDLHSLGE
jgi:hypothetical protein